MKALHRDCTEIHLFRHGETEWNKVGRMQGHLNSPLSAEGVKQAVEARKKIAGLSFDHAYCSSSGRALETLELLLDDRDLSVTALDELREIHLGRWEGMAGEEVKSNFPEQFRAFWQHPEVYVSAGGESFDELCHRAVAALENIFAKHPGQRLLLVSHAAFLKTYLCQLTGLGHKAIWQEPKAKNLAYSVIRKNGSAKPEVEVFCDRVWRQQ